MELADAIVAELGIEHFFNIQLVGEHVIEINPRISTIVYQEDLNLPYLGVKRALGEISDEELAALRARVRPGRTALRYFDQLEWDAMTGCRSRALRDASRGRPRRSGAYVGAVAPVHPARRGGSTSRRRSTRAAFVTIDPRGRSGGCATRDDEAGRDTAAPRDALPGQHRRDPVGERQALRARRRRAARRLQPRPAPPRGGLVLDRQAARQQLRRSGARSRGCCRSTDVFHFYFGLTLVPKSLQFPILRARAQEAVFHYLGSDIRGKTPERARLRQARGRGDRRLLRRDPLGARRAGGPARARPARVHAGAAVRPRAAARRARAARPQRRRARST